MSAFKFSARIVAAAAVALGLAASCGQLLGDYIVTYDNEATRPILPDAAAAPEIICEVGTTACDGKVLRLCIENGTDWTTLEVCGSEELCESSDMSASGCLPPECAADQMSCQDNLLRLCNVARNGWELFDTCESAAHCDAGAKRCLPAPCEPGDRRCNVGNLEACNANRTAWEELDSCETNELCEATLAPPTTVGEVMTISQLPTPEVLTDPEGRPIQCRLPVCVPKEVRCDEVVNPANLIACNEGQTDFAVAEDCATPKLCQASITYTGLRGSPRCVRPTCAVGEHRCTESGALELCNVSRDGFDQIAQCIGAPFCNAVAADNGGLGCEDAPCDPGEQQCNGPQILVCSDDQTEFVARGAACETRGLCNDDNAFGAFCQDPVCQRGPFSGTEFRCEGTSLRRCNDQHTGDDQINTCATPALCNASLGFSGCQPPACRVGETRCNGDFVQRCNADRTGFESTERCDPGTCDGSAGRCADPCIPGSARCNSQGNLEECRNTLVGREVTARCGSVQLCDASGRTCRQPPAGCTADGVRRCRQQGQNSILEVCSDGRSRFATLDTCTPGEVCDPNDQQCDVCQQGSGPACEGNNNLATCAANGQSETNQSCGSGCDTASQPDRCRNCVPGAASCDGRQLVVCRTRNGTEVQDRQDCDTPQLCQATLASCSGEACRCATSECAPGQRRCNGAQPETCNAGRTGFQADGSSCGLAQNCNPSNGRCFACAIGDVGCNNGQLFGCAADRSGFTVPLGGQRCASDNNGERSQTCNGSTLVNTTCQGATRECVGGVGCQECDPVDFDLTCIDSANQAVCVGGDLQNRACPGAQGCLAAVCDEGEGACNTESRIRGTECTRPGNAGRGFCDGLDRTPSCVECVDPAHCDDRNECTTDSCSINGACQRIPRAGLCNGTAGECDGTVCRPRRICNPGEPRCTGAQFQRCNPDGTAFVTEATCASAGLCSNAGCGTACVPSQCEFGCANLTDCNQCNPDQCSGTDPNTCSVRQCNGTRCTVTPPPCPGLCVDGVCRECVGNIGCNNGELCQGNECVAVCDPNECNGVDFATCGQRACNGTECTVAPTPCPGLCILGRCRECVGNIGCNNGELCQGNECVAACDPNDCEFGCNDQTNACNACTQDGCGPINPASCDAIRVCNGGPSCIDDDRDGLNCGDDGSGTCNGTQCVFPGMPVP